MAQSRTQQLRKYNTGEMPVRGDGESGTLFVNSADRQLGVIDENKEPIALLPIRHFSERCVYHVDEFVIHNGHLHKCQQMTVAGPFDPSHWIIYEAKQGEKGEKGDRGAPGQSIVGPMGPQGHKGDRGEAGVIGTPVGDFKFRTPAELPPNGLIPQDWDGPNRPPVAVQIRLGQGLIHSTDGHVWVYVGTSEDPNGWIDGGHIIGPPGPQGDVGPPGPQGIQGIQGERGDAGRIARPVGDFSRQPADLPWDGLMPANWDHVGVPPADIQFQLGDALEHVPTGDWWLYVTDVEDPVGWINIGKIRGPQGIRGEQGPMGPTGPAGRDGRDGRDGLDGSVGVQGPKGDPGPASTVPGPQGPAGPAGQSIVGPQGPQGLSFAQSVIVSGAQPDNNQGGEHWFWIVV